MNKKKESQNKMKMVFLSVVTLPVMAMLQLSGLLNWQVQIDSALDAVYSVLSAL